MSESHVEETLRLYNAPERWRQERKFRPRYQRAKKPGLVSLEQCWKRMQEEERKRVEQWKKEHGYA